jgi:murein DD-endopeptidase MepM/ murein hydrolase activator NlpD
VLAATTGLFAFGAWLTLASGQSGGSAEAAVTGQAPPSASTFPRTPATVRWSPDPVTEGRLFTVIIEGEDPEVSEATGSFGGEPLHFASNAKGALTAMAAAPLDSVGSHALRVNIRHADGSVDSRELSIDISPGGYPMESLTVAPRFSEPQSPELEARIERESERVLEIARRSHETPRMWSAPFIAPREGRITSGFGSGRVFNGTVESRHTGTDFAGAVGAPVTASARGVVALVDDFYLGGNVIYIDHGAGLVTGYFHLSEQLVAPGDRVEAGDRIGLVGATGRVTGPHLHWIVRYGAHSLDGESLIAYSPDR